MFHDPDFMPFAPNERPNWRSVKSNYLENWPPAAYRDDYFKLDGVWPFIRRTHYLADPELIEEMLVTRAESFERDFITVKALSSVINRDALFFVEGADWKWQRRALAREAFVDHVREALLLGVEPARFARVVDRRDAGEERAVVENLIAERGELGGHFALNLLHRRIAQRRIEDRHQHAGLPVIVARALHGFERVGEARRVGIGRDCRDLGAVARHGFFQRRREMLGADRREIRRSAMRACPGRENGIIGEISHRRLHFARTLAPGGRGLYACEQ